MSSWVNSVRRRAIGGLGAGAIAGGLLFGAAGIAEAAPAPAPAVSPVVSTGFQHAPMPEWGHHHGFGGHHGFGRHHHGFGRHGMWRHHHRFGRMWFWR